MEEKRRRAWQNLIAFARYHRLKVAPAWRTYEGFARDVSLPPAGDHALRRLKPAEGFKPGNVVWALGRRLTGLSRGKNKPRQAAPWPAHRLDLPPFCPRPVAESWRRPCMAAGDGEAVHRLPA